MLPLNLFVLLTACLSVSAKLRIFNPRGTRVTRSSDPYAKLQARAVPVSTSTAPTRAGLIRRAVMPAKSHLSKRTSITSTRIAVVIRQCLDKVHTAVGSLTSNCEESHTPEETIKLLQKDLRDILDAVKTCLADVKDCESAPAPSGGFEKPPTLPDICQLLIELIDCIASIIKAAAKALKSPTFHQSCGDILSQINDCIAQIITTINSHLPDTITTLSRLGRELWQKIQFYGFNFSAITNIVKPL